MIWLAGAFVLGLVGGFLIAARLFYVMREDFSTRSAHPKD